jgi:hypothetical protein
MKNFISIIPLILLLYEPSFPCNVCGGGTNDIGVLALDGRALFGIGFDYDHYLGVWNEYGKWLSSDNTQTQKKIFIGGAYRLNRFLQFNFSVPYVWNYNNIPGYKARGSGIGDLTISGRYEFFHEFQLQKVNGKNRIDKTKPYLAVTFGFTLPTGKSIETAEHEADITGKGYYMTSLGVSLIKSIIRNRFQVSTDLSWQHSFEKTYNKYFGQVQPNLFKQQLGDKFNYSITLNYIFGSEHAVALTISGFLQNSYTQNGQKVDNTNEKTMKIGLAYSYYPTLKIRITPTIKYSIAGDNFGKNATGSFNAGVSITYYIPDYTIK